MEKDLKASNKRRDELEARVLQMDAELDKAR